jgi:hypothetical protein
VPYSYHNAAAAAASVPPPPSPSIFAGIARAIGRPRYSSAGHREPLGFRGFTRRSPWLNPTEPSPLRGVPVRNLDPPPADAEICLLRHANTQISSTAGAGTPSRSVPLGQMRGDLLIVAC